MGSSFTPLWLDVPRTVGLNYESMGKATGDNVSLNGDVFLNAENVGRVMNRQNAQEYNNLERSGAIY